MRLYDFQACWLASVSQLEQGTVSGTGVSSSPTSPSREITSWTSGPCTQRQVSLIPAHGVRTLLKTLLFGYLEQLAWKGYWETFCAVPSSARAFPLLLMIDAPQAAVRRASGPGILPLTAECENEGGWEGETQERWSGILSHDSS